MLNKIREKEEWAVKKEKDSQGTRVLVKALVKENQSSSQ